MNFLQNSSENKLVRIYCVSAFVFLRLLCPALLNPKSFGLKFYNSTSNPQSPSKNILNYTELADKFSVFTPSFMFTLSPHNSSNCISQLTFKSQSALTNSSTQVTCFNISSIGSQASSYNNAASSPSSSTSPSTITSSNSSSPSLSPSSSNPSQVSLQITAFYDRHIKLLAKVLQTLANMTECKEAFMLPLSEFLNLNKPNIIKFIEEISNLNEISNSQVIKIVDCDQMEINDELNNQFENSNCKYLAILHRLLTSFLPQMKAYISKVNLTPNKRSFSFDETINVDKSSSFNKIDEIGFVNSLQKLVTILNNINNKTK